jgi:hypothetical protein
MKHLQHTSETLAKHQKKLKNTFVTTSNIYKHPDGTLATYV